jgi:hypothetical protein
MYCVVAGRLASPQGNVLRPVVGVRVCFLSPILFSFIFLVSEHNLPTVPQTNYFF